MKGQLIMKASQLFRLAGIDYPLAECEINNVTDDSRKVSADSVFVCISGANFDGHTAAASAVENGASVIVATRDTGVKNQIIVEDTRQAYSLLCAAYFGKPSDKLCLIGVTGTNGKTTTCFLIKSLLEHFGCRVGLVGTVKNMVADVEYPSHLTTPDPFELQELFARMVDADCQFCVMEVSSQALAQDRVSGCRFESAVFTNLTQDHLDYHGTAEEYAKAKQKLFRITKRAIVNMDDRAYSFMLEGSNCESFTFSTHTDDADFTAKDIRYKPDGVEYVLVGKGKIARAHLGIPGGFSVYNSIGAAVCVAKLGFPFEETIGALSQAKGVPGRIEVVPTDTDYTVIIDYAHSPDGLLNILTSVKEFTPGRVFAVFGCGGNRDKTKRPKMGRIAAENADYVIVTSDNPRHEDPDAIVADVLEGTKGAKVPVTAITDRTQAIAFALSKAKAGDTVLLAGKGHETYQIFDDKTIHYDEREVVKKLLNGDEG